MTVSIEVTHQMGSGASEEVDLKSQVGSAHEQIRRFIVRYCLLQAIAVVVWWISLFLFPNTKFCYWPEEIGASSLYMLMWSDLMTYVVFGVGVAWLAHRRSNLMRLGLWTMLGGITYATILSLTASITTAEAALGATLMGMSWIGFLHLAIAEYFSQPSHISKLFRNASKRSAKRNVVVTGIQLLVFWPLILGVFPWLIAELQRTTPIPFFDSQWSRGFGWFVFFLSSIVNLHTAWTMANLGAGTPFPYDKTNYLVSNGLYGWIRNPMAVTGLAQGGGIGFVYGSTMVLVYVLCGGLIWHFLVRPIEEEMLADQFGSEYLEYKKRVGLWLPNSHRNG